MTQAATHGESFHRLANLFMLCGGFLLAGSWVLYNILQSSPSIPIALNYILWGAVGTFMIISSFVVWYIGHLVIIEKIKLSPQKIEVKTKENKELSFKSEYYFGIGIGLLAISVGVALGNNWIAIMFVGFVFVLIGVYNKYKKR